MNRMELISRGVFLLVIMGAILGNQVLAQPIKAPYTISTPGTYELSDDARGLTDIYGITIECDNVVLDGGNHFLGGEDREKSAGIYVNKYGGSITNITIKNFILEDWETGIGYNYVKGIEGDANQISKCNIVKCITGIHVQSSDYITIAENEITDCSTGVVVEDQSTNTNLEKNTIARNGQGVSITQSPYTLIENNNINSCTLYGLEISDSDHITVKKNAISDNKYSAIKLDNSQNSVITGNNLSRTEIGAVLNLGNEVREAVVTDNIFASFENVVVDAVSSDIVWNSTQTPGVNILGGPYLGGNYWSDEKLASGFSDTAPDLDGFGIADTPYKINEYNFDYLPLTKTTATKAPEEQVTTPVPDITPASPEIPGSADTVTTGNTSSSPVSGNMTEKSPDENAVYGGNGTQVSSTTKELVFAVDRPSSGIDNSTNITKNSNITGITESVAAGISPAPGSDIPAARNGTPLQTVLPLSNSSSVSVLNNSVTNAYPAYTGIQSQSESLNLSTGDQESTDGSIPAGLTNQTVEIGTNNTGTSNQTVPASVGYLVFNSSVPDIQVFLKTTNGNEVSLDPMIGYSIKVPVPVEGLVYTMYRAYKDGYNQSTGMISSYPGPGETTAISVDMSLNGSAGSIQNRSGSEPVLTDINLNESAGSIQNRSGSEPVPAVENDITPIVVTNGVVKKNLTHTIRASAGPGGAIFPEGSVEVEDSGAVAFIIDPFDGRRVAYLVIDGIQTSPMTEYRFINVTTDHTIVTGFV